MTEPRPGSGGIRDALPLVIAGFAISFFLVGGGIDTVSVFLNAITKANDWSRSGMSLGVSVGAVMAALSTPFVGLLVDRYGVRVPMTAGVLLLAVGFLILVSMHEPWHFVAANVTLGPGFAACALLPITVAVTIRIPERTTLALGIIAAGSSAGALALAPAVQAITETFGWRGGYVALGTVVVLTPLPCLLFALPRGRLRPAAAEPTPRAGELRLAQELRQPGVAPLAAVMILPGLVGFSVSVHLVPYLAGLGHPGAVAAGALGATIGISAIGKIGGGLAGDHFGPLPTLRCALLLDVLALLLLQYAVGAAALSAFVILYGLALGAHIAVIPAIAVTVLNAERFGTLFGVLQLAAMLASAIGPIFSGVIYDKTGQYTGAIVAWVVAMAAAAAIACWMRAAHDSAGRGEFAVSSRAADGARGGPSPRASSLQPQGSIPDPDPKPEAGGPMPGH
jgi:MFS family permease